MELPVRKEQSCYVDGHLSSPMNLFSCGVPQGSIGGPLLWLCFTCDQPDVTHDHPVQGDDLHRGCGQAQVQGQDQDQVEQTVRVREERDCGELVGYVDDGAFSFAHKDPEVLSQVLTRTMLEEWINSNKLEVNPDKTHLMVMRTKRMAAGR